MLNVAGTGPLLILLITSFIMSTSRIYAFLVRQPWHNARRHKLHFSRLAQQSLTSSTSPLQTRAQDEDFIYKQLISVAEELKRHDDLYYNQNKPDLSDEEYDSLCRHEEELCRDHPTLFQRFRRERGIDATRYLGRVGIATDRQKRRHGSPMLSLDNANSVEDVMAWLKRMRKNLLSEDHDTPAYIDIRTEPKLDGVSLNLRYERRKGSVYHLSWASTRGDGNEGQDVTQVALNCRGIPDSLVAKMMTVDSFEVRGELVLPLRAFQEFVSSSDVGNNKTVAFSNARNAASGILLRKENSEEGSKLAQKLEFFAYDVKASQTGIEDCEPYALLEQIGFNIPSPHIETRLLFDVDEDQWGIGDTEILIGFHDELESFRSGKSSAKVFNWGDFDMDGCVHKVTDPWLRYLLGSNTRAPRWAIAHKFAPTSVVTELLDISAQVGRTGAITPVAELKPVSLNGVTVQRATLHNFGNMQNMFGNTTSIPKGTLVHVQRAGDVIPKITKVVGPPVEGSESLSHQSITLTTPTHCPACGSDIIVDGNSSKSSIGRVIRCGGPGLLCPPRRLSSLQHAFSRDALDVKGLSVAKLDQLVQLGVIEVPADLFKFARDADHAMEILTADSVGGWGEKSANNLLHSVTKTADKGVSLARYIYSLGIRHVGVNTAFQVATVYKSVDRFLAELESCSSNLPEDDVLPSLKVDEESTKGLGPALWQALMAYGNDVNLLNAAKALRQQVKVEDVDELRGDDPATDLPLAGERLVFTGALPGISRSDAKAVAQRLGAVAISTSVTKRTTLVVVGGKGGSKLKTAEKLNIRTMSAEEFLNLRSE